MHNLIVIRFEHYVGHLCINTCRYICKTLKCDGTPKCDGHAKVRSFALKCDGMTRESTRVHA